MKNSRHGLVSGFVAAGVLCLGLGAGAAGAQTVEYNDPAIPDKVTAIRGLVVLGETYDVEFQQLKFPNQVYGAWPGSFTFNTGDNAQAAVVAVNAVLNGVSAESVGEPGVLAAADVYWIGYESFEADQTQQCRFWRGGQLGDPEWRDRGEEQMIYSSDGTDGGPWAKFLVPTPVDPTTWGNIKSLYRS